MEAFRIDPLASVAMSTLKPLEPPTPVATQGSAALTDTQALIKELAQALYQQTQKALTTTATDLTTMVTGPNLSSAAALLASMASPQATPPVPAAEASATSPTAPSAVAVTPSTPTPVAETVAPSVVNDAQGQEQIQQNAMHFGANVLAPGSTPTVLPSQLDSQIRDATSVARVGGLQAEGSRPGPEAFARPRTPLAETLHAYQAVASTVPTGQLDVQG